MALHEEYERYGKAGINSLEEKLDLSRVGIHGIDAEKYSSFGFHGKVEAMKVLKRRFDDYLHDPSTKSSLQKYIEAGFAGNLDAILELSEERKFSGYRISPDGALFLAEHGLKGDKDAMLDIPAAVSIDTLENLAYRIAFRLEGKDSYANFVRKGKQGGCYDPTYVIDIRKKFAEQISVSSLVLLTQYNFGEEEAEASYPLNVELKKKYGRKFMFERLGNIEALQEAEREIRELHKLCFGRSDEIEKLKDDALMRAYGIITEQGDEAFKGKYKLNEGWIYDEEGKLYYDQATASKLLQEKWDREDKEVMEMYSDK